MCDIGLFLLGGTYWTSVVIWQRLTLRCYTRNVEVGGEVAPRVTTVSRMGAQQEATLTAGKRGFQPNGTV